MNFNADYWKKSEFVYFREVRDELVNLVVDHGMTEVQVTFQ